MANWDDDLPAEVWGGEKKATPASIGTITTQTPVTTTGSGMGDPKGYYDQGMKAIGDMAAGTSPIFKSQENRATQNFGGAAIAALGSAKQNAAQSGLSQEAIGSVAQTTAKNLEGERSKMQADIATSKQNLATTAASNLVSGGLSGMGQQLAEQTQNYNQMANERSYGDAKKNEDWSRLLEFYDPSTPDGLSALQTAYVEKFGGTAPDFNALKEQREYLKTKQQQDVALGGIGVSSAEQQLKDQSQASIMSRIASGYSVDRINTELGSNLTQEEYDKMRENTDTYFTSKGIDMQEASLYGYTDSSGNHVAGNLEIAAGQFQLQGKTYEDQKREMFGYTDENGKVIAGRYEQLSDAAKQQADSVYGYETTDANGNTVRVMGTLELANSADDINRQGLSLQEAQIKGFLNTSTGEWVKGAVQIAAEKAGVEISSLYGYTYNKDTGEVVTDPTEIANLGSKAVRVDGALVLAQKDFGLKESSYELQYAEMYGKTPDGKAVIGTDGKPVQGRIELLSSESQRAANQLYGYDTKDSSGNTVHISGTLEVMNDELEIKKQGLSIDEAQAFGYDKTVDGKTVHVSGALEIENEKLSIIREEAQTQRDSEAGTALANYFGSMKNVAGWNYANDQQAKNLLQTYWESSGNTGTYDAQWAQNQFAATTISATDAALSNLEKEKWYIDLKNGTPDEKRQAEQIKTVAGLAAMLSITQGAVPVYNDTGDVVGLKDSEGNVLIDLNTTTATSTVAGLSQGDSGFKFKSVTEENAAWKEISKEAEKYGITIDRLDWEKKNYPTIDTYKSGVNLLDNIKVESYSELLTKTNSEKVFNAYNADPDSFKNSDYYYKLPDMSDKVTKTITKSGIRTTRLKSDSKAELEGAIGKIIDIDDINGKLIGQLTEVRENPADIQVTVKKEDGTYETHVIY